MEMLMRGADPMALVGGATLATEKKPGAFEHKRTWYETPGLGEKPPTDEDDFEIPDVEIAKLAMKFPNAVKRVSN